MLCSAQRGDQLARHRDYRPVLGGRHPARRVKIDPTMRKVELLPAQFEDRAVALSPVVAPFAAFWRVGNGIFHPLLASSASRYTFGDGRWKGNGFGFGGGRRLREPAISNRNPADNPELDDRRYSDAVARRRGADALFATPHRWEGWRPMSKYDTDIAAWAEEQATALRQRASNALDWENLAEEIEAVGISQKKEIRSRLAVLCQNLLKWQYQHGDRS